MTTKELLDRLLSTIGELTQLYAELSEDLPQLRFVRTCEFSEVKKMPEISLCRSRH